MKKIIESDRVYLRELLLSDVNNMLKLDKDPDVIKYLQPPKPDEEFYIKNIKVQNTYYNQNPGLGAWTAINKSTGEYIGYFALKYLKDTKDLEISYGLLKEHRKKGYCFEVSKKLVEYAFNNLKVKKLIGIAHPENEASLNVLQKLGMKFMEKKTHFGLPALFHSIENN